jgi:isopentenyl diphosphate isomerase/L-lactate dehydrogenase-like FMN-dependent dehydrogenase
MRPINLFDYETLARERLDQMTWDYFMGGSDDEVTLRRNHAAYEQIRLRPRALVNVATCDTMTTVLGTPVSMPVLVAPMAYQALAHRDGECAMARGTGAAGTLMVVSTLATRSLEEVAEAATGPLWFQLYVYAERRISEALVRRAEAAGYQALVLTVDFPRAGRRERDERNRFVLPPQLQMRNFLDVGLEEMPVSEAGSGLAAHANANIDPSLTWEALDWLRSLVRIPVLVKGIMTGEDATLAVEHGAAAIIVSNHGGRQLDGVAATIEVLPEVVRAAAGRCEIYVDGGIRRGTDVLKALALGAHAVLVGRPALWGLAADGADGVGAVLEMLRAELDLAMALAGRPTVASVDATAVTLPS